MIICASQKLLLILWDFKVQTDHQIPARRPDIVLINKNLMDFAIRDENERRQTDRQILGPCLRIKKTMEQESEGCANWGHWNSP